MPTNFEVKIDKPEDLEKALKIFKRATAPIVGRVKKRMHRDKYPRRNSPRKRQARRSGANISPLSAILLSQREESYIADRFAPRSILGFEPKELSNLEPNQKEFQLEDIAAVLPKDAELGVSIVPQKTKGAIVIPRYVSKSGQLVEYGVQKDKGKSGLGFVYGGCDKFPDDTVETTTVTAKRELGEERNVQRQDRPIELDDFVYHGTFAAHGLLKNHTIDVFTVDLPEDAGETKGEEQDAIFRSTGAEVEEYITENLFNLNHSIAWEMIKKNK